MRKHALEVVRATGPELYAMIAFASAPHDPRGASAVLLQLQSGTERTERTGPAGLRVRRDASLDGWFPWLLRKSTLFQERRYPNRDAHRNAHNRRTNSKRSAAVWASR